MLSWVEYIGNIVILCIKPHKEFMYFINIWSQDICISCFISDSLKILITFFGNLNIVMKLFNNCNSQTTKILMTVVVYFFSWGEMKVLILCLNITSHLILSSAHVTQHRCLFPGTDKPSEGMAVPTSRDRRARPSWEQPWYSWYRILKFLLVLKEIGLLAILIVEQQ